MWPAYEMLFVSKSPQPPFQGGEWRLCAAISHVQSTRYSRYDPAPPWKGAGGILKAANLPNHSFRDENFMLGSERYLTPNAWETDCFLKSQVTWVISQGYKPFLAQAEIILIMAADWSLVGRYARSETPSEATLIERHVAVYNSATIHWHFPKYLSIVVAFWSSRRPDPALP